LRRGIFVRADPRRLAQVVANVLRNVLELAPSGSHIVVASERVGDRARVEVLADGDAVPPEIIDQLFEPFFQRDDDLARARGGLGIGLALARGILELHGGTITASARAAGRGTVFTVELPIDWSVERSNETPMPGDAPRVLIVD